MKKLRFKPGDWALVVRSSTRHGDPNNAIGRECRIVSLGPCEEGGDYIVDVPSLPCPIPGFHWETRDECLMPLGGGSDGTAGIAGEALGVRGRSRARLLVVNNTQACGSPQGRTPGE